MITILRFVIASFSLLGPISADSKLIHVDDGQSGFNNSQPQDCAPRYFSHISSNNRPKVMHFWFSDIQARNAEIGLQRQKLELKLKEYSVSEFKGDGQEASKFFDRQRIERQRILEDTRREAIQSQQAFDKRLNQLLDSLPRQDRDAALMAFVPHVCQLQPPLIR